MGHGFSVLCDVGCVARTTGISNVASLMLLEIPAADWEHSGVLLYIDPLHAWLIGLLSGWKPLSKVEHSKITCSQCLQVMVKPSFISLLLSINWLNLVTSPS